MPSKSILLLVQPERDDREMYAEFFRHRGWRVISVPAARGALRVAAIADVIVTGILLPGHIDGLKFVAQLKADEHTKAIPAIVLTACAWDTERARAESAGCDVFLAKPCLPADLLAAVRRVLALRRVPEPKPANVRSGTAAPRARRSS